MQNQSVQIAFQGGGARLAAIIAAVEAIDELRVNQLINPVMVSGTSAGAVGAVLTSISIGAAKHVAEYLGRLPSKEIEMALPPLSKISWPRKVGALGKVAFGMPLTNDNLLRKLLVDCLSGVGITKDTELGALPIPTKVIAADIRHADKMVYFGKAKVIDSLMNSMSLPGIYSMPKARGRDNSIVDGGLFSNLPIEELDYEPDREDEFVPKIAISFKEHDYGPYAEKTLKYLGQVLSAVIDEKVRASIRKIGEENVCLVDTPLSLFDSHKITEHILGDCHNTAKKSVFDFFDRWLPEQRDLRLEFSRSGEYSDTRRLNDIVETLNQYADAQRPKLNSVTVDHIEMTITAHSLDCKDPAQEIDHNRDDTVEFEVQVPEGESPISCMRFQFFTVVDLRARLEDIDWSASNGRGEALKFYKFPIYSKEGRLIQYVLVFDPPIGDKTTEPGPYKIYYTQKISGLCWNLIEKKWDAYAQSCGSFGFAKKIDITYCVPKRIKLAPAGILDEDTFLKAMELEKDEFPHQINLVKGDTAKSTDTPLAGFDRYVWRTQNINRLDTLAVRYFLVES